MAKCEMKEAPKNSNSKSTLVLYYPIPEAKRTVEQQFNLNKHNFGSFLLFVVLVQKKGIIIILIMIAFRDFLSLLCCEIFC